MRAVLGFQALGPEAACAVPSLIRLHRAANSDGLRVRITRVLGGIGQDAEDAIPLLLNEATNTNPEARCASIVALAHIKKQPDKVIPALILALHDPTTRFEALKALQAFGTNGISALPDLEKLLQTNDEKPWRYSIRQAIKFLNPEWQGSEALIK